MMKAKHCLFNDKLILEEIHKGNVVGFPTETVYGLGVIYNNEEAFERLVRAKDRRPDKPFTLMLGNVENVSKYAEINEKTEKIIKKYMPGEITLLLKPKAGLYPWVTLGSKYIGIRVPDYKEVCDLINSVGEPMLVTSANMSGEPVCKNFDEVCTVFDERIDLIVEGNTRSSRPSTIVICDEDVKLVREGNISFDEIKKTWEE